MRTLVLLTGLATAGLTAVALAQSNNNVSASKHNLSISGPGPAIATSESQVCVFCHTPHAATLAPGAPLWNRELSTQTYTTYTSSSLDAGTIAGQLDQPAGSSKLCLSCHDGSLAIATVNFSGGEQDVTIDMVGLGASGEMPAGAGLDTGFTRNLGTDLRNDHPISLTYDTTLAGADGELRDPSLTTDIGVRVPGTRPLIPLEGTGPAGEPQVQCVSCHDPHIPDPQTGAPQKFLRLNRFQEAPPGTAFDSGSDIMCLGCHDKEGWETSAHALPVVADETYTAEAAQQREFAPGTAVWEAACLNCHDSHTVHGSRRLLREGTDSLATPKSGGNPAIEETCYQCHSGTPAIENALGEVKNIEAEFQLARRMPLTNTDQQTGSEAHDIVDADLTESRASLGRNDPLNRHAECTDCHNPHRALKNSLFNGTGDVNLSAHQHGPGHTNLASGALSGASGVEPLYGSGEFLSLPMTYEVKSGVGTSTDVNATHVTREYQICLKCHSDYGYTDDGVYPVGSRPNPGDSGGGTPAGTNGLQQFTNQAMEFQAPLSDMGETGGNHRSWHPVMAETGRSAAARSMNASTNLFLAPWDGSANIGTQTMYCSDCHGSATPTGTVVPSGDNPWGPHGSDNDFILKGTWDSASGGNNSALCFRCHSHTNYATEENRGDRSGFESGFGGPRDTNLHAFHADRLQRNLQCSWCHVAVPHGWKNKALLVDLNNVGAEAGLTAGTEISISGDGDTYTQGPYYMNAKLKIRTWRSSGTWREQDCGSASGQQGTGRDWMRNVCETPP